MYGFLVLIDLHTCTFLSFGLMYVCIYIYYISICIFTSISIRCFYMSIFVNECVYIYIFTHILMHLYVFLYVNVFHFI